MRPSHQQKPRRHHSEKQSETDTQSVEQRASNMVVMCWAYRKGRQRRNFIVTAEKDAETPVHRARHEASVMEAPTSRSLGESLLEGVFHSPR